jgi:hypothetical protein
MTQLRYQMPDRRMIFLSPSNESIAGHQRATFVSALEDPLLKRRNNQGDGMMRYRHSLLLLCLILLCFPSYGYAQLWSGVLASGRASNWSTAGVQGGIPSATWPNCNNTNCNNLASGSGNLTAADINTAVSGAQVNGVACSWPANPCVVRIRAGSFTLTSGISPRSGVVIRGAGANQTFLDINGPASNGCGYGTWNAAVGMCAGGSFPTTDVTWSAGYAVGTTSITLPSCSGITAGVTPLHLNQLNETDGFPATGDMFICDSGGACNSSGSGGAGAPGGMGISGRAPALEVLATACSGGVVTITPPISMPNFRAAQSPQAHYPSSGTLFWTGLEDVSIDYSYAGNAGIEWINTSNTWVRGIRMVNNSASAYGIALARSSHVTIRDSYFYRSASSPQGNYAFSIMAVGSLLMENNICHGPGCALITTDNSLNDSVFGYNFSAGNDGPGFIRHLAGEVMNLIEGNIVKGIWSDAQDGTGCCWTAFRNALIGNRYNAGGTSNIHSALMLNTNSRFWNVVGNVIGDASLWTVYQGQTNGGCSTSANMYDLGGTSCGGGAIAPDARVAATLVRWGNWDEITSSSPNTNGDQTGTRWCRAPLPSNCGTGNDGTGTPQNETASGIVNFPGLASPSQTLPPSFYLSARPSWWPGNIPFPPIGPDVQGGTISNLGGHVHFNPAADCYFNVMGGPPTGGGSPLSFNAATCYASASSVGPFPPTNLAVQ